MKNFMDEKFMLSTKVAEDLYNDFAKDMPIIDYHCHISPQEICENKSFKNITEVWLYGDHYKWRLMRSSGVDEKYITGDSSDYEKFLAYVKAIETAIGNPLYHWSHLELQRYFGVYEVISEKNAPVIWEKANKVLNDGLTVREIIKKSNVKAICTTDDPIDSLEYHLKLKEDTSFNVKVLPAFRPDKALGINKDGYTDWVSKLAKVSKKNINSYDMFLEALNDRIEFFHSVGGRVSDHALDYVPYLEASKEEVNTIFAKALKGEKVSFEEETKFRTFTMKFLGKKYASLGWAMELHMNAKRDNNTRMYNKLGPDTGFDSVNDNGVAGPLSRFLDSLEKEGSLPKTIIYSLNPNDNFVIGTLLGCFQGTEAFGKIQFGAAWWFNDHRDGMVEQMETLANLGAFSTFIGMLTDSRSFLSYTRHEYFRRILCDLIGKWVENGEVPNDMELLGRITKNICFNNANNYFEMGL
ncbi:glucuronate isomerase [Clostridium acetobutylicum]|uniref:Uronate isomerase n=1 Tax=Clostridium acetobutylicum (strain ATCC 824 / DSM 792 / JCM 1419 / IAM 19013 / LMG 5710 / NBRC 13948 / NRRL B-527 / VKM B-1787 / 2291 / W) TaxID=272562 RepID=UXAC_CLOAB|nr:MULTISPECIES: glucuronate isomerase [Clostridium]Q97L70.1 RecName: Full=Uronate isomerase; AltName: Full=Glucuronate isomerase; AltName: Full=Uronic isomerase [Clostridium acetobutylicum ATCC 824]AAK78669.1 Glucuronate isomerase [Clostridium acetobutylicum ATCC 824]ADZ19742.1 glucuronate isomerase [Clostridium acetobutylicum EA 2018]AEI33110.1 glucuronate isomerase [Clostridium acetobutylicum DSM 1731]AWV80388.1 glucuronate isomerase [Clostridium acetobutylicum]MBC2392577.1 glucuronate iso